MFEFMSFGREVEFAGETYQIAVSNIGDGFYPVDQDRSHGARFHLAVKKKDLEDGAKPTQVYMIHETIDPATEGVRDDPA